MAEEAHPLATVPMRRQRRPAQPTELAPPTTTTTTTTTTTVAVVAT